MGGDGLLIEGAEGIAVVAGVEANRVDRPAILPVAIDGGGVTIFKVGPIEPVFVFGEGVHAGNQSVKYRGPENHWSR